MQRITIFVSSPSDVEYERKICKKVLEQMNSILAPHFDVYLDPFFWENSIDSTGMGIPQARIPSPETFDLYIGILWKRFGTPTGDVDVASGRINKSGTEAEFRSAYNAWIQSGYIRPEIKFFHKKVEETDALLHDDQYQQVKKFLKDFDVDGEHPGLYYTFDDDVEFESAIQRYVFSYVMKSNSRTNLSNHYDQAGITDLFLRGDNETRNRSKSDDLDKAMHIRLIAHSGNSFLSSMSQRFFPKVEACLARGGKVDVILANPYSQMGYFITLGDTNRRAGAKPLVQCLREADVEATVRKIDRSPWVAFKQRPAISGFEYLCEEYGDRIRLRFCSYEMNSTIFMTETVAYHEPYLHCVGSEYGMNAFELRVKCASNTEKNNFYNDLVEYFNLLWEISEDYEVFLENEDLHRQALLEQMKHLSKRIANNQ